MALHRTSILGGFATADNSGFVFVAPGDAYFSGSPVSRRLVWVFDDSASANIALWGQFEIPANYQQSPKFHILWAAAVGGTFAARWEIDYKVVADAEEYGDATADESAIGVTSVQAALLAFYRTAAEIVPATPSNFVANRTCEFALHRDQTDAADTLADAALLFGLFFEYDDVAPAP